MHRLARTRQQHVGADGPPCGVGQGQRQRHLYVSELANRRRRAHAANLQSHHTPVARAALFFPVRPLICFSIPGHLAQQSMANATFR